MHTEICTSTKFCTQHRNDLGYNVFGWMKQNLKQLGVRESRLHCTCLKAEENYTLLLQEMLVMYCFYVILYTVCQIFFIFPVRNE